MTLRLAVHVDSGRHDRSIKSSQQQHKNAARQSWNGTAKTTIRKTATRINRIPRLMPASLPAIRTIPQTPVAATQVNHCPPITQDDLPRPAWLFGRPGGLHRRPAGDDTSGPSQRPQLASHGLGGQGVVAGDHPSRRMPVCSAASIAVLAWARGGSTMTTTAHQVHVALACRSVSRSACTPLPARVTPREPSRASTPDISSRLRGCSTGQLSVLNSTPAVAWRQKPSRWPSRMLEPVSARGRFFRVPQERDVNCRVVILPFHADTVLSIIVYVNSKY